MCKVSEKAKYIFDKYNYFSLIKEEIFVARNHDEEEQESLRNLCIIELNENEKKQVNSDDLKSLILKIVKNKEQEIIQNYRNIIVVFYMWHDEMADQLRFSFITYKKNENLPFNCKIILSDTMDLIIKNFLGEYEKIDLSSSINDSLTLIEENSLEEYELRVFKKMVNS